MEPMRTSANTDWIETPKGRLGRMELHDLAARLGRIGHETRELIIDWQNVSHLDFRGLSEVAFQLRRLQDRGVMIRCRGFNPYVLAIWHYALSLEGLELIAGLGGGLERLPAQDRMEWRGELAPVPSSWSISEN
jgi:hypothetical protein